MGYTIQIGEAVIDYDIDDDRWPTVKVCAKDEEHKNAPAFGEPTDYTNKRWPSYSGWDYFTSFVGLHSLWFGTDRDDCLLADHPGVVPLTRKHVDEINKCMDDYREKYPAATPTFGGRAENSELCRLIWLHYWANWAIDNCVQPVVYNS